MFKIKKGYLCQKRLENTDELVYIICRLEQM